MDAGTRQLCAMSRGVVTLVTMDWVARNSQKNQVFEI
jgi:hypothetical protein